MRLSEHMEKRLAYISEHAPVGPAIEVDVVRDLIAEALNNERAWLGERYVELCNDYGEWDIGQPSCEFIYDRIGLEAKS